MSDIRVTRISLRLTRTQIVGAARGPARRGVLDVCRKVENQAIVNCPVDTGLLRSGHKKKIGGSTLIRGEVYNAREYAEAVHDGSKPHLIVARRGKALRFSVGGRVVYARSARHPGSRARPWLADAARMVAARSGNTFTSS